MCPVMAQLWINAGMVRCTQLVGLEHVLVHSMSSQMAHSFMGSKLGPSNCIGRKQGKSKHLIT